MKSLELAEKSGYAASYISDIENNKTIPNVKCLEAIAKALNCSLARIIDNTFYMPGIDEPLNMNDYPVMNDEELFHELKDAILDFLTWDERSIRELLVYRELRKQFINK